MLLCIYGNADITTFEGAKKACEDGIGEGCHNLGVRYVNGQGVEQNQQKANEFFGKACDSGIAGGCYNLGLIYINGRGVKESYTKASEFFGKACDGGNAKGCEKYPLF